MFFRNNRISLPIRPKIPGIYRILCVGDSLTYGHGVHLDETLPRKLEESLNSALWSKRVEVLNESNCGFSFFDEKASIDVRGKYHEPDLLIVILCSNDTELNHSEEEYTVHLKKNWDAKGSIFPYFKHSFMDFCKNSSSGNHKTVVVYYDLTNSVEEKKYSSQLSELCSSNGMKFIDLSSIFIDMDLESLTVSKFDRHPSALAHRISSKEIARVLLEDGLIRDSAEMISEAEIFGSYWNDAEKMIDAGYPHLETAVNTLNQ